MVVGYKPPAAPFHQIMLILLPPLHYRPASDLTPLDIGTDSLAQDGVEGAAQGESSSGLQLKTSGEDCRESV